MTIKGIVSTDVDRTVFTLALFEDGVPAGVIESQPHVVGQFAAALRGAGISVVDLTEIDEAETEAV